MIEKSYEHLLNVKGLDVEAVSEDIQHQQVQLGINAREILENDAFMKAFTELRAHLLVQWQDTDITDTARREALWHQLQCADLLHDNLRDLLETGKLAEMNLTLKREKKSRTLADILK